MLEEKLPGDYIAGFVDGEGCFAIKFSKEIKHTRKNKPAYYRWGAEFVIYLKKDDANILKLIQKTLKVGTVRITKKHARYSVQNIKNLYNNIIPYFKKYRLRAKKAKDFELWIQAVNIIYKNKVENTAIKGVKGFIKKEWAIQDLNKLIAVRNEMLKIKASRNNDFLYGEESINNFNIS